MPETILDLGRKVKAKYPGQYDDLSDVDVGRKVKAKYPTEYADFSDVANQAPARDVGTVSVDQARAAMDAGKPGILSRFVKSGVDTATGMASGMVHAYADPATPEELKQFGNQPGPIELGLKRTLVDPSVENYEKFKAAPNLSGKIGYGLGMIPIAGPLGTSLGETAADKGLPEAAGQAAVFAAAPKVIEKVAGAPRTAGDFLRNRISPEARMAAAERAQTNIKASESIPGSTTPMALFKAGVNMARQASIPINKVLANFAADGRPFGINRRIPITGEMASSERSAGATRTGQSADTVANRLFRERTRTEDLAAIDKRTLYGPENQARPAGVFPEDQPYTEGAKAESAKLNVERPSAATALRHAIEEATPPTPPAVLDAPSINKWIGAKSSQMMRGADPGARLLSEKLIGADKEATAANVKSALGTAGSDLAKILEKADESGQTINAKSIIDDAIADATKKFGIKSDEAYMKQIEQISTDAFSEFPDLAELKPSRVHELKVRMGNSTRFDVSSATQTEVNALLKKIYGELNDKLKNTADGIGPAQTRWGDLYQASKALKESLTKDRAGRGSGAAIPEVKPTAADRLRGRGSRVNTPSF